MIDFFERLDKFMIFKGLNDNKITLEAGISNGLIGITMKKYYYGIYPNRASFVIQKNSFPNLGNHFFFGNF